MDVERQVFPTSDVPSESTLNRHRICSIPSHIHGAAYDTRGAPGGEVGGSPGPTESRRLWGHRSAFLPGTRMSSRRCGGDGDGDGCRLAGQDFRLPCRGPGKLKTWEPDVLLGLAAARISDFQDSRFSPHQGHRGGRPCRVPGSPGRWSGRLLHG